MMKSFLIAMGMLALPLFAHSQVTVRGGLADFGIQNPDTVLHFTSRNSHSTPNKAAIRLSGNLVGI